MPTTLLDNLCEEIYGLNFKIKNLLKSTEEECEVLIKEVCESFEFARDLPRGHETQGLNFCKQILAQYIKREHIFPKKTSFTGCDKLLPFNEDIIPTGTTNESTDGTWILLIQWWMRMYKLRETTHFTNSFEVLEFYVRNIYNDLDAGEQILEDYWRIVFTIAVSAFTADTGVITDTHRYCVNEHPLELSEIHGILKRSKETDWTRGHMNWMPKTSYTELFFGHLFQKCNQNHFTGLLSNNIPDKFQRTSSFKWYPTVPNARKRRTRLQYLFYKMLKGPLAYSDQLVHHDRNECNCPPTRICLNPECYDIVSRTGSKRVRTRTMTTDEQHIVDEFIKNNADFTRKNPWVDLSTISKNMK